MTEQNMGDAADAARAAGPSDPSRDASRPVGSIPIAGRTPGPWKFVPWHIEEGPSAVRAPEGWLLAHTSSDANAAFIVLACNSFDASIALAERIVATAEAGIIVPCYLVDDARALLSRARGEQS